MTTKQMKDGVSVYIKVLFVFVQARLTIAIEKTKGYASLHSVCCSHVRSTKEFDEFGCLLEKDT